MSDEDKDLRRVGRDEMNLCEFPIATASRSGAARVQDTGLRGPTRDSDRHRERRLRAADRPRLGRDRRPDPTDQAAERLHRPRGGVQPVRAPEAAGLGEQGSKLPAAEGIAPSLGDRNAELRRLLVGQQGASVGPAPASTSSTDWSVPDEDDSRVVSSFTWGKDFFNSCRADNLKRLDLDTYFSLKSAISKQLYRFLDKRFYLRRDWTFGLEAMAFEHVGISRTYGDAGRLKAEAEARPRGAGGHRLPRADGQCRPLQQNRAGRVGTSASCAS